MRGFRSTAPVIVALLPITLLFIPTASGQELSSFGVLAGSTITNTGSSVINGNIGVSPGTAIVGFPPGIVTAPYAIHANDGVAVQAQIDLVTRYNSLAGAPATVNLTGQDLGGLLLTSGVYSYDAAAQLTGTVTLDGQGNPNSRFVFNVGSALTTASASAVQLINGAQGANVFFVIGSSATLGTGTAFAGDILALTSITLNTGATINCGAALARNGAVTLDTNTISVCVTAAAPVVQVLGGTTPAAAVASVLDAVAASGAALPPEFTNLLAFLSPAELQVALSQLSGEVGTAVAPAGVQAMRGFLSQLTDRTQAEFAPWSTSNQAPLQPDTGPATVRVLGYGVDEERPLTALDATDKGSMAVATPRASSVWASVYGDHGSSDGTIGSTHDRTVDTIAFAIGADYRLMPDALVGVAVSGGRAEFDLADRFGEGRTDLFQAAFYGRKDFGAAYFSGAIATGLNQVSTERIVTVGLNDRFTASFNAYDIAGQIETGYRIPLEVLGSMAGDIWLTPYGALQIQSFHTPSYSETADSGSTAFALNYDARTNTSTQTELGIRLDHSALVGANTVLALRTRLAWAHENWSDDRMRVSFQALPGQGFALSGADGDADAALVSAGAELGFANGFSLAGLFDSRLSQHAQAYSGTARLSYRW